VDYFELIETIINNNSSNNYSPLLPEVNVLVKLG